MYSLNIPVSAIRTKIRQEFERHRFVNQLPVVDMLLFKSHAEYQVRLQREAPRLEEGLGLVLASPSSFGEDDVVKARGGEDGFYVFKTLKDV